MSDFQSIDARRRELGLSKLALCRAAKVPVSTYWRAQKQRRGWRNSTLKKLNDALAGKPVRSRVEIEKAMADLYRAYVVILARELGHDASAVLAVDPRARANFDPVYRDAAYVRALAIYCVTIELGVGAARVAWAVGLTRAGVSAINKRVEDFRDDPKIDELVERVGALVSGREA